MSGATYLLYLLNARTIGSSDIVVSRDYCLIGDSLRLGGQLRTPFHVEQIKSQRLEESRGAPRIRSTGVISSGCSPPERRTTPGRGTLARRAVTARPQTSVDRRRPTSTLL